LYGCEELSFSIREEHSFEGVCREGDENRPGREEVAGNSSKLGDDDKRHASCSSLNVIYLLTYLLNLWGRAIPEKLTALQPVKNFSAFYGTRGFITTFTSARHLSLS
jgi:hypothetical protein